MGNDSLVSSIYSVAEKIAMSIPVSLPHIAVLILLGYCLSQARRVTNDVMNHVDKLGEDAAAKTKFAHKSVFNFYLILCAILVFLAKIIDIIKNEVFIAMWVAIFTGLGIKLTTDAFKNEKA